MTDKEIIIDGVDVSKCEYLNTFSDCDGYHDYCELADNIENQYCKHYANCYYKQLQCKTAECEELKEQLEFLQTSSDGDDVLIGIYMDKIYRLSKALDEIEKCIKEYVDNKELYNRRLNKILDIINKVKVGNND